MKVYFGKKYAVLTRTNGSTILGLVPKLNAGRHPISVVCGNDSVTQDSVIFKYEQTKSVKTVAGAFGDDKYQDGDLNTARFKEVSNIATVKGTNSDNVIAVESWWNARVSLISPEDNSVVTLSTSHSFGTPAVDNTREKFYLLSHWSEDAPSIPIHARRTMQKRTRVSRSRRTICPGRFGRELSGRTTISTSFS